MPLIRAASVDLPILKATRGLCRVNMLTHLLPSGSLSPLNRRARIGAQRARTDKGKILEPLVRGGQGTLRVVVVVAVRKRTRLSFSEPGTNASFRDIVRVNQPLESMRRGRR